MNGEVLGLNILIVSQYCRPEVAAGANRVYENAKEWIMQGHHVTVLTGFPNYPSGVVPENYKGLFWQREILEQISIIRVPIIAVANKGIVKRSISYSWFFLSLVFFGWLLLKKKPDVIIATSPQILVGMAGLILGPLFRCPVVLEIRDLWPESFGAVGLFSSRGVIVRIFEKIEKIMYYLADHIVVVTQSFVDDIERKGISRINITFIPNGVNTDFFTPKHANGFSEQRTVLYAGNFGMAQKLSTILEAAKLLENQTLFKFLLVGDGAEKQELVERANYLRLSNVVFMGLQSREEIVKIIASADVCIVPLRKSEAFLKVIPSKIFDYMAMEKPILLGVDGECRQIVEESGGGIFFEPENSQDLSKKLLELFENKQNLSECGRQARIYVKQKFSRSNLAKQYLTLLEDLAVV